MRKLLLLLCAVSCMGVAPPDQNEISEITLERTPCFGTCPVDTITLHPDGTADYFGKMNVARIGHFKGRFNKDDFARLSKLLTDRKFFDFHASYWPGVTDQPGVATTVKRGDKIKRVDDNGRSGPIELWALEMAIAGVAKDINWKKVE